jgi:mannosyl-3-phosphoglycerate phosphatase family protein
MSTHKIVFTDIDGTLIDINSAEYGKKTKRLISIMREKNIPLILTSAKTRIEQDKIRDDLGLTDPFIIENGGAVFIPNDYFPEHFLKDIKYPLKEIEEMKKIDGYKNNNNKSKESIRGGTTCADKKISRVMVIELGKSSSEIRARLSDMRKKYNINFIGVADISVEELSNLASMPLDQAKRMAQRAYGETLLRIQEKDIPRFTRYAQDAGMKLIHGGRFFDVTAGNDKGIAVGVLKTLFKNKFHNDVTFYGIGDSTNDIPMLNLMDVPIIVQQQDRSWLDYGNIEMKNSGRHSTSNQNIIKINGIGPDGWENAIYQFVLELN